MASFDIYKSTPAGSLIVRSEAEEAEYLPEIIQLSPGLLSLVMSSKTSGYIRGITKAANLPLDLSPQIAFVVLRVVFGKIALAQLSAMLSTELRLPNDVGETMAKDIEKELFGPVMVELNQYLQSKQSGQQSTPLVEQPLGTPTSPNLLDLRQQGPEESKPT